MPKKAEPARGDLAPLPCVTCIERSFNKRTFCCFRQADAKIGVITCTLCAQQAQTCFGQGEDYPEELRPKVKAIHDYMLARCRDGPRTELRGVQEGDAQIPQGDKDFSVICHAASEVANKWRKKVQAGVTLDIAALAEATRDQNALLQKILDRLVSMDEHIQAKEARDRADAAIRGSSETGANSNVNPPAPPPPPPVELPSRPPGETATNPPREEGGNNGEEDVVETSVDKAPGAARKRGAGAVKGGKAKRPKAAAGKDKAGGKK